MKKFLKILKYSSLTLLVLVAAFLIYALTRSGTKYETPYPEITAGKDSSLIARGKYLVYGPAHCVDCHAPSKDFKRVEAGEEVLLSGGNFFDLPIGKIYVPNITPDNSTGIGSYTDGEIARTLRYGVKKNNEALMDFMPFYDISNEDLRAIISFLRSEKAVNNPVPKNKWTFMGKIVKALGMIKPMGDGIVPESPTPDTTAEYGKYIAGSIANCRGCHTKRDLMTGAYIGPEYAGQMTLEVLNENHQVIEDKHLVTPNLTPDRETGRIFYWDQETFIKRIRQGRIIAGSPMPWEAFSRMSERDLKALYKFFKSLKPVSSKTPSGVQEGAPE